MPDRVPDAAARPEPDRTARPGVRTPLDTVIQQLFAAGLTVQAVAASLADDERGARLADAVDSIDITIREVRNHMEQTRTGGPAGAPTRGAEPRP